MPIFAYECNDCKGHWDAIVIAGQEKWPEPTACPHCGKENFSKLITAPAAIRMDGKTALRSLPDPHMPLRELQGKQREGCEGGFEDLPDVGKLESKVVNGVREWKEKEKPQVFDLGKK